MKKFMCWLMGHQPRGPIFCDPPVIDNTLLKDEVILYRCGRCKRLIRFKDRGGWEVWHNTGNQ